MGTLEIMLVNSLFQKKFKLLWKSQPTYINGTDGVLIFGKKNEK